MNADFLIAYVVILIYIIYKFKFSDIQMKNWEDFNNWTTNLYNFRPLLFCLIIFIGGTIFIIYTLTKKVF